MRATRLSGVLGLVYALAGCTDRGERPVEWFEESGYRWRVLQPSDRVRPGFTQLSASRTRLEFENVLSEDRGLENENLLAGSGVALGDVDGDGRVDIYLARLEGPNALFKNLGGWRFEDVTDSAGVAAADRFSTGATFADIDGDDDLDLFVTALGGPNALYVNDGSGRFTDGTAEAGLTFHGGSMTATLADVEGDGDLDLYVANYKARNVQDIFPPQERGFDQVLRQVGEDWEVVPHFRDHYRVLLLPQHSKVVRIERAEPDLFYLNDGTGRFEQVGWLSGRFLDEAGHPLEEVPDYFGLAARFYDIDRDNDPDLYVCNDFEDPDFFLLNDGAGTFRAAPRLALRTTSNAGMAVDFADIDRDGDVDFFEIDMLSREPLQRRRQRPSHTALPKLPGEIDNRPQMQRNTLFLNRGDNTFAQIAELSGVTASGWSWGVLFADIDLDGYEDILVSNGMLRDVQDSDADRLVREAGLAAERSPMAVGWPRTKLLYPPLRTRNVAFRNRGDWTFEEVGTEWGFATDEDISHGIAAGDLDGDGDLDVVVNRLGDPVAVFRNETSAPRVAVRLVGRGPNSAGAGAKIRIRAAGLPDQEREVTIGGLYLSSSDTQYAFAARGAERLLIEVRWRSGARSVIADAAPNRLYEIREPSEPTAPIGPSPGATVEPPDPWFVDASSLLGHVHSDSAFDDWVRQPLLPNSLSQLGPGVAWYDVDEDGDEDLLIPTGRGGRFAYYRNDGARFTRIELGLAPAMYDQTMVLGIPNPRGGTSLLVGQMNYEAITLPEVLSVPGVQRVDFVEAGGRSSNAVIGVVAPGDTTTVGPLALADVDGDSDLDLFVGGRALPGLYPIAASSRLLLNREGRFERDDTQDDLTRVGLVSGATFSDIDADGDPDLVLAVEWGPIKLLINDGGRFRDASAGHGLDRHTSRWNGVTTGDVDGDGRLDIVATSWGRNTRYQVSPGNPVQLWYGAFDSHPALDLVEAQFVPSLGGIYPLDPPARLSLGMPGTRNRFSSVAEYAEATVEELTAGGSMALRLEATTFDHMLFLNRGSEFEAVPLPAYAQLAPAFHVGVSDLDGDSHEDVFLSQNFFATEVETPRYDSGRGLLLRGDGTGRLEPVPGQVSGIQVYGEQRGAAFSDFDADGRLDLVVTQNAAATVLYRNVRGRRGLRVRLIGSHENPRAVGAGVRVLYQDGTSGPVRQIHAGSGYWSMDGAVQVMGLRGTPATVQVRWPGGSVTEFSIPPGAAEVTIRQDG